MLPISTVSFVPLVCGIGVSRIYRFPASSPIICVTNPSAHCVARPVSYDITLEPVPAISTGAEYAVEVPVGAVILNIEKEFV